MAGRDRQVLRQRLCVSAKQTHRQTNIKEEPGATDGRERQTNVTSALMCVCKTNAKADKRQQMCLPAKQTQRKANISKCACLQDKRRDRQTLGDVLVCKTNAKAVK
eukprot:1160305-Pelagomonas_calceolata.AAC.2